MPRRARLDASGTLHHVIVRGIENRLIFADNVDRGKFLDRLGRLSQETETKIYAWALLSNHAHFLLRSGPKGLSNFMRRLLTGYAQEYNRRHRRNGHLFQNRFKSIVCQEEIYFQELVRYIHLNPLRAGLVQDLKQLEEYKWSGHGVLMGKWKFPWQDSNYVLSWFGNSLKKARKIYQNFTAEGIKQGRRPDLVGGGLIRSLGGWSVVKGTQISKQKVLADERILGKDDFVEKVLNEAEQNVKSSFPLNWRSQKITELIEETCKIRGFSWQEIRMGSRRREVSEMRSNLVYDLARKWGAPLAEIARQLGVSTSAISQILKRRQK